ncbi:DDE-type integrase/transposase/recombinase [Ruegeria sediminis]|uniref:DDE-type integrase/transposase/recombinase n=1 Tax=Ruegeria sediminis TaxID=2583820 RepID=A0ABY2WUI0_9RHOB|nr:Mu transposase C-terminal domain-containing protein [Ruegeria sediminis]TMV05673.1 DDE-type integrase/transposase/recombinase [Ruegeria sediminis]
MIVENAQSLGDLIDLDGAVYEVVVRSPAFVIGQSSEGKRIELSDQEYRQCRAQGRVKPASGSPTHIPRIPDEAARREQQYRIEILREINETLQTAPGRCKMDEAIGLAHARVTTKPAYKTFLNDRPKRRTVFYWRKAFAQEGRDGLLPRVKDRGNRTARHDMVFEDTVLDILDRFYGTNDRLTVTALSDRAKYEYLEKCAKDKKEPNACGRASTLAVLNSLPYNDLIKMRLDSQDARQRILKARYFHHVELPLDLVEIDCTPGNIILSDPLGQAIGRPTICAAVDAATGWPLSLVVSLRAPHSELVSQTLRGVMSPTSDDIFDRAGIQNRKKMCGRPKTVSVDQGSENGGDFVEPVLRNGGIEWFQNIPGHPEDKPFVERFFRELNQFIETLPGSTASPLMQNRTRTKKAMNEASLTIEDFETILQKWRFDVYGKKARRKIQSPLRSNESPIDCWNRLAAQALLPDPPTPEEMRAMFMVSGETRVLQKYGIEVGGIQYNSDELMALLAGIGPKQRVEVQYDPADIREIAVLNPLTNQHFPVPAKETEVLAVGFQEARLRRKKTQKQMDEDLAARATAFALAEEADRITRNRNAKSRGNKVKTPMKAAREIEATRVQHQRILDRSKQPTAVAAGSKRAANRAIAKNPVRKPAKIPTLIDME